MKDGALVNHLTCPKCGGKLWREEPGYGWCFNHGSLYLGNTLPWLRGKQLFASGRIKDRERQLRGEA